MVPAQTPIAVEEMAPRLRFAVARLNRLLRRRGVGELTLSLQSALSSIANHGPVKLSELAAIERVAPPTVTKMIGRLEDEGLVARFTDPADGRATLVSCTDSGEAWIAAARSMRTAWLAERLSSLSPAELESLVAAIAVLESLAFDPGESE
jgi:DNA-binding MarR family transcriptional regulator